MTKFRAPTFFASRSSGAMPTRSSISLTFSFAMMEKTTARMVLVRQSTSRDHRLMAYSRNGLRIIVADLLLSLDWMEFRLGFAAAAVADDDDDDVPLMMSTFTAVSPPTPVTYDGPFFLSERKENQFSFLFLPFIPSRGN